MSYQNELTRQQERNFRQRARFTMCGEPAEVFAEPVGVLVVTVNHNTRTGASWYEGTPYRETYRNWYIGETDELAPWYVSKQRKAPEDIARRAIVRELDRWASMPEGTVTGWTPDQIEAEAERIRNA